MSLWISFLVIKRTSSFKIRFKLKVRKAVTYFELYFERGRTSNHYKRSMKVLVKGDSQDWELHEADHYIRLS
jgi:hypothetical protein